jgi:response regulator RpfG family c-di-GMP phosphodiesterase
MAGDAQAPGFCLQFVVKHPFGRILEYIRAEAGTRFDPEIVKLFLKMAT